MAFSLQSRQMRRSALVVFLLVVLPTIWLGMRTYGSFRLLRSAYEAGAPTTSSIRAWMTLGYVANTYRVSNVDLIAQLGLPSATDPNTSLTALAERAGEARPVYVQRVQRAVAGIAPAVTANHANGTSNWLGMINDQVLTALLVYGYPILGATLLLGAIGLPLPDGVITIVAGSLAAQGRLNWAIAGVITVLASILGDAVGYGLGRLLGRDVFERHGQWIGYTAARRGHVQLLFEQWGALTIFITRTFASYLSSVASLLTGMSRYRLSKFLAIALTGRVIWTAAYLGLGYSIGADWEAATGFLTNLSGLIVALVILAGSGLVASGRISVDREQLRNK